MNRCSFPVFQITGWVFCETGVCDKINSESRTVDQCRKERANYSPADKICEVVIEITIRFTVASANSTVNCTADSRENFTPQCAFGKHYTVVYSEAVSIHFFSFLRLMLLNRIQIPRNRGRETFLLIVRPQGQ